jgi:hypothetical protein
LTYNIIILRGISLFIFLTIFNSCDLITEPDRIINQDATPPVLRTVEFGNLSSGQHIDGTINIEINTDSIDFEIREVRLIVDDNYGKYDQNKPYIFELNTRNFPEGLHNLTVAIYNTDPTHGMLNLLYPPSVVLENELFFDRTPPQAVQLNVGKSEDGKNALLNWTESTNLNFYAYRIFRAYKLDDWNIIDTLYEKTRTSYTDSTIMEVYGMEVTYKVEVCTNPVFNYPYTIQSNEDTVLYGKTLDYQHNSFVLNNIILNKQVPEIYFVVNSTLLAFSTENETLLKETLIPSANGYVNGPFTISDDNSLLYIYNRQDSKITIINSESFSILRTLTLPFSSLHGSSSSNIIYIDENKVLIITASNIICTIDTETGAILDSTTVTYETLIKGSVVTENKNFLIYSWSNFSYTEFKIFIRDLSSQRFPIVNQINTDFYYDPLLISADGQKLYGLQRKENPAGIEIRDVGSLELVSTINTVDGFSGFTITDQSIYAATRKQIVLPGTILESNEIIQYNVNTLQPEKSWIAGPLHQISTLAATNENLYTRSFSANIVAIVIPLNN